MRKKAFDLQSSRSSSPKSALSGRPSSFWRIIPTPPYSREDWSTYYAKLWQRKQQPQTFSISELR